MKIFLIWNLKFLVSVEKVYCIAYYHIHVHVHVLIIRNMILIKEFFLSVEQNRARRRLVIDLAYPNISTSFCEGVKDTLAQKLKQAFASIDTRWSNQICGQPDCSDVTFVINCQANSNGRRKRQTTIISPTSVDITIPTSL